MDFDGRRVTGIQLDLISFWAVKRYETFTVHLQASSVQ